MYVTAIQKTPKSQKEKKTSRRLPHTILNERSQMYVTGIIK
jgi:hypothetical protein